MAFENVLGNRWIMKRVFFFFVICIISVLSVFYISFSDVRFQIVISKPIRVSEIDDTLLLEIESVGNLPTNKLINSEKLLKCARRPNLPEIEFSNVHWQVLRMSGVNSTIIFLYGAYIDTRVNPPVVRIIFNSDLFLDETMAKPKYCQFWYDNLPDPVVSNVTSVQNIWAWDWGHNGRYHPYLLTCPIFTGPFNATTVPVPSSVSLVERKCGQAYNDLKINHIVPEQKKDFGVCVRGLDFPTEDLSVRLVEWIEMMKILGVEGIHFHILSVHPNVKKVLEYYEKRGQVTTKAFSLPGYQPNLPVMRNKYTYYPPHVNTNMWRQEVTPYNDCFLQYMYTYKYIAVVDTDEIILPVKAANWKDLLQDLKLQGSPSPCFSMILFVDKITASRDNGTVIATAQNIPDETEGYTSVLNKLNYELKTVCNGGGVRNFKCLHNTENVLILHNHFPRVCLKEPCFELVDRSIGYVHHHKDSCWKDAHNETMLDNPFGYDDTILKYADELVEKVEGALSRILL